MLKKIRKIAPLLFLTPLLFAGCGLYSSPPPPLWCPQPTPRSAPAKPVEQQPEAKQTKKLRRMGYAIQVGAFSNQDNAVRLEAALERKGIEAFYFRHESGLYKVRFGNHGTWAAAKAEAEKLRGQGVIDGFFIVAPEDYLASRLGDRNIDALREELVRTAQRFLGTPYRWGGITQEDGFDCSGLTLVCYRLNGLDLPRVSYNQFDAGAQVDPNALNKGDLVFFDTRKKGKVSHVGIYIGEGRFIHAPRTGKNVEVESLSTDFYRRTFMGARSYL